MNRPVLPKLPLSWLLKAAIFAVFAVSLAAPSYAQNKPAAAGTTGAVTDDQGFRVTIRPRPRIGAPPDLQEMVIHSADGSVMFFVEWLLRPKMGSATGEYGDFHQTYFDIGKPIKEDPGARYRMSGPGDFSKVMGPRYLGLSFDEIARAIGYEPTALEARFDAGRGPYEPTTTITALPYDPLYSSFGKVSFDNTPCKITTGQVCGAFKSR